MKFETLFDRAERLYSSNNNTELALTLYSQALADPSCPAEKQFLIKVKIGSCYYRKAMKEPDLEKASQLYRDCIRQLQDATPTNPASLNGELTAEDKSFVNSRAHLLANCFTQLGNFKKAILMYQGITADDRVQLQSQYTNIANMIVTLLYVHDYHAALEVYQRLLTQERFSNKKDLHAEEPSLPYLEMFPHIFLGISDKMADKYLDKLVLNSHILQNWLFNLLAGMLTLQLDRPEQALRYFSGPCSIKDAMGAFKEGAYYKGLAYAKLKNDSEALKVFNEVITANPYHWQAHCAIGWLESIEMDQRIEAFNHAVTLSQEILAKYLSPAAAEAEEASDSTSAALPQTNQIYRSDSKEKLLRYHAELALINRASFFQQVNFFKRAIADYTTIVNDPTATPKYRLYSIMQLNKLSQLQTSPQSLDLCVYKELMMQLYNQAEKTSEEVAILALAYLHLNQLSEPCDIDGDKFTTRDDALHLFDLKNIPSYLTQEMTQLFALKPSQKFGLFKPVINTHAERIRSISQIILPPQDGSNLSSNKSSYFGTNTQTNRDAVKERDALLFEL